MVMATVGLSSTSMLSLGWAMTDHIYEPSPIKRRRSTSGEMAEMAASLYNIVSTQKPMTVRQCYYRATVAGLIDKTEAGYKRVQRILADMRRAGRMPYSWLTDSSRTVYQRDSFNGPEKAAAATARFYRKALWTNADCRVEVWLEKDALSGVLYPVTDDYDVCLYVARGFSSLSFLHAAAEYIAALNIPSFIYHLGDHDPSGVMAGTKIAETLRHLAPDAEIHFIRLAVTEQQIAEMRLPSRPTKASTHARGWVGDSVELDAIEPDTLRAIVREAIERHLPAHEWRILKAAEQSERQRLWRWAGAA